MAKALSYIRFSTPGQKLGDSLRRQTERTAAYCVEHGLDLDETLRDEGVSGFRGKHVGRRGALGRFLARVKAGEIPRGSVLIVEAFDRLSRQTPREALAQFLDLINAGIVVVTLIDGQQFDKTTVDANVGQIFLSIGLMLGAHSESKTKSDRVRASWGARREKITRMIPAWLAVVDGRYLVKPEARAIITTIF